MPGRNHGNARIFPSRNHELMCINFSSKVHWMLTKFSKTVPGVLMTPCLSSCGFPCEYYRIYGTEASQYIPRFTIFQIHNKTYSKQYNAIKVQNNLHKKRIIFNLEIPNIGGEKKQQQPDLVKKNFYYQR